MATTGTGNITQASQNYLSVPFLSRAYPRFVHPLFGQVRDIPMNNTTDIRFRKYGSLSAATTALTEGVTPDSSQISSTDITATALQYGKPIYAVSKSSLISLFLSNSVSSFA